MDGHVEQAWYLCDCWYFNVSILHDGWEIVCAVVKFLVYLSPQMVECAAMKCLVYLSHEMVMCKIKSISISIIITTFNDWCNRTWFIDYNCRLEALKCDILCFR